MFRKFAAFALILSVPILSSPVSQAMVKNDYAGEFALLRDSKLYPKPRMDIAPIATLPAGSKVTLSGKQESVLAEAVDSKGRRGWVSIQDIRWM